MKIAKFYYGNGNFIFELNGKWFTKYESINNYFLFTKLGYKEVNVISQQTIICSESTVEILGKGGKDVQS